VIPPYLIELGQQALAVVTTNVASGAPLVQRQLLACNVSVGCYRAGDGSCGGQSMSPCRNRKH
jgi:hypothetical protein